MSEEDGRLILKIDGKELALNPFAEKIVRKTVLAMVSTLRDTAVTGKESVEIKIQC